MAVSPLFFARMSIDFWRLYTNNCEIIPSLRIPILRHFLRRQYWHWFLWCWSMGQLRLPRQEYDKFLLTLRLKKLLHPRMIWDWDSLFWTMIMRENLIESYIMVIMEKWFLSIYSISGHKRKEGGSRGQFPETFSMESPCNRFPQTVLWTLIMDTDNISTQFYRVRNFHVYDDPPVSVPTFTTISLCFWARGRYLWDDYIKNVK